MSSPETPRKSRRATAFKGNYAKMLDDEIVEDEDESDIEIDDDNEDEDVDVDLVIRTPSKVKPKPIIRTPKRSASHNLFTRSNTDLDRSARKRATRLIVDRLLLAESIDEEDILNADDQMIAEAIIRESRNEKNDDDIKDQVIRKSIIPDSFGDDIDSHGKGPQIALFLEGPEGYFDQHKLREKISSTPFSKAPKIEYQEFVESIQESSQIHEDAKEYLSSLYTGMFPQWKFELYQNFSLLFYGIGSKRNLIMEFVSTSIDKDVPILVSNGYNPATTFKEILNSSVSVLVKEKKIRSSFPKQPGELVDALLRYLSNPEVDQSPQLVLVVHNLEGEALRPDRWQVLLAKLVSAKQICFIASVDHINSPILLDAAKLSQYNFLWHDITNFELYTIETSFEDPLALGSDRSVASSKGVQFVLSSLTANARKLYEQLIYHQISLMSEVLPENDTSTVGSSQFGIEFKQLYMACKEQLIVSSELNFRTMLGEFFDHKMAMKTKDQKGQEIIYVPFTKDAIEKLVEEFVL